MRDSLSKDYIQLNESGEYLLNMSVLSLSTFSDLMTVRMDPTLHIRKFLKVFVITELRIIIVLLSTPSSSKSSLCYYYSIKRLLTQARD